MNLEKILKLAEDTFCDSESAERLDAKRELIQQIRALAKNVHKEAKPPIVAYSRPKYVPKWIKPNTDTDKEVCLKGHMGTDTSPIGHMGTHHTTTDTSPNTHTDTNTSSPVRKQQRDKQLLERFARREKEVKVELSAGWIRPPSLLPRARVVSKEEEEVEVPVLPRREVRCRQVRVRTGER